MAKQKKCSQRLGDVVGWRELVGLPDFNIEEMRAKIDTGARTSALHAEEQEQFEQAGEKWVRFKLPAHGPAPDYLLEAQVIDERDIKNTGGVPERRLIIRTTLLLGRHRWKIDVSLADRKKMEFDLILGRTAVHSRGVLINPRSSFIMGRPLIKPSAVKTADD
jgi:hypothetical protein